MGAAGGRRRSMQAQPTQGRVAVEKGKAELQKSPSGESGRDKGVYIHAHIASWVCNVHEARQLLSSQGDYAQ
jgi:hypothetical protein